MTDTSTPIRTQLSADDRPIGDYVVDFRLTPDILDQSTQIQFELKLEDIPSLRRSLDNAEHSLRQRMLTDAICRECEQCRNTRMVDYIGPGGRVNPGGEHCPVCTPKIAAVREAFAQGRVPT